MTYERLVGIVIMLINYAWISVISSEYGREGWDVSLSDGMGFRGLFEDE